MTTPGNDTRNTATTPQPLRKALELGESLSESGIRFVHWKSNSHLAEALAGMTDIDMFADPAQQDLLRKKLRSLDCLRIVSQPWASYADVEDWLAFDGDTGNFLHLHLHFALVTGLRRVKHLRLPWGEALLAHTDRDLEDSWPTPEPELELLVLLVRMWAKMPPWRRIFAPRLPVHVRDEFRWLLSRCSADEIERLTSTLVAAVDPGAVSAFVKHPPQSDHEVIAVSRRIYACLRTGEQSGWTAALMRAGWLNMRAFSAKRLRKVRPATVTGKTVAGNGAVVAFVGSDGSGKSTVTGETRKWLGYKLDVHGYYMGSGQSSTRIYDVVRHAIKARSRKGNVKVGTRPEKQRAPRFHDRVLALRHLLAIRSKVRSLRQAHRLAASGSLVVLDRFPQTQFSSIYDGPRLQNGNSFGWAARAELDAFHEAASLAPHLVVKLVVPPEIGHSRKPDHNFATIKRKAEITEQLQFPQSRVSAIDASQPLDQVMLAVKKAVWRILRERAEEEAHGSPAP